jgi:hypothetical protein
MVELMMFLAGRSAADWAQSFCVGNKRWKYFIP